MCVCVCVCWCVCVVCVCVCVCVCMIDWCVFDEWLTDVEANMTFGGQESPCPSCLVSQRSHNPVLLNWLV